MIFVIYMLIEIEFYKNVIAIKGNTKNTESKGYS